MADEFRGEMGALDKEGFDAFLGGKPLARLACLKPDGSWERGPPKIVPE